MSYIVLARRYRPLRFEELVGQEHVTKTLKNALQVGRSSHAYLFTGPRGVGKTSAARILAKALRCMEPRADAEPCNKCEACKAINDGNSMDVLEIDAASNTGVENIRELKESVAFMPSVGKHRIYIIDEVHMLSASAFNALLKTLEEPPPHVVFIFATTELHKVPATIQSRCQSFDFKRIPLQVMRENLASICKKEGINIDDASLRILATESEGCLRDAQSLLDQSIALCGTEIRADELESALGLLDRASFFALARALGGHNPGEALKILSGILDKGMEPKILLSRLIGLMRDLNYRCFTGEAPVPDDAEFSTALDELNQAWGEDEIIRGLELCLRTQSQLNQFVQTGIAIESLVLRLCLQRSAGSLIQRQSDKPKVSTLRPAPSPAPKVETQREQVQAERPAPAPQGPARLERGASEFKAAIEDYIHSNKPAWTPVLNSILDISMSEDKETVRVLAKADFAGKRLNSKDGVELIKKALGKKQVTVSFDPESIKAAGQSPKEKLEAKHKEAKEHQAVKAAMDIFGAKIVETQFVDDKTH